MTFSSFSVPGYLFIAMDNLNNVLSLCIPLISGKDIIQAVGYFQHITVSSGGLSGLS